MSDSTDHAAAPPVVSPRRLRARPRGQAATAVTSSAPPGEIIDLTDSPPPEGASGAAALSTAGLEGGAGGAGAAAGGPGGAGIAGCGGVRQLPLRLTPAITGLGRRDHALLLKKRDWLRTYRIEVPRDLERSGVGARVVGATLVFGGDEAGTAVCVESQGGGLLLTCCHCVGDHETGEVDEEHSHWLVFASGQVVEARAAAWDQRRDLALLKIVAAQAGSATAASASQGSLPATTAPVFPSIPVADDPPPASTRLVCVGHPAAEDLEADQPGVKTNYDVLHLSTGAHLGLFPGQDPHDNSEIGALMHSCWTYWGHSGAPLVERRTGKLVGLHSSWDEMTGTRRGVALEAIQAFLREHGDLVG